MIDKTTLGPDEARSLTDKIKARSDELWHLLLQAYEGGAHTALGYGSWGDYFEAEYGGSKSRAYQLIDAGRVVKAIEGHSTTVERASIPNERVAREIAPLAKEDPKTAGHVLDELIEEHGDDLTGAHTKKAVTDVFEATAIREKLPPKTRRMVEAGFDPDRIVRIVRAGTMEYAVKFANGDAHTVPRSSLLDRQYKKCTCCDGYGVVERQPQ
jgi:hypothetical protein